MNYLSTRGGTPAFGFEKVLLAGLAPDGGLFVPESWPRLSNDAIAGLQGLAYPELAARLMTPYLGGEIDSDDFAKLVDDAYRGFDAADVVPLVELEPGLWIMELFHGPTLAFKDIALQVLGRLFDHVLARRGERITIVGATSGDTGSAAIEACRDRDCLSITILHPKGRISEVQRRQMTTVGSPNVHNIAIEGTFDDCQALVKGLFGDTTLRAELNLAAVNSINWVRVMAQSVYYVHAGLALDAPARGTTFSVPTGNFGDVYAGHVAAKMGLPVDRLIVATNRNDILTRFFESGVYAKRPVEPSLSPSMDIQVASNFERLLFELLDRDGEAVANIMARFAKTGELALGKSHLATARERYRAHRSDDDATLATIADVHQATGRLIDPHTATGIAAARALGTGHDGPVVCLATAHPAKFPDAVEQAAGVRPALPSRLAGLMDKSERVDVLPNDLGAVREHIRGLADPQTGLVEGAA